MVLSNDRLFFYYFSVGKFQYFFCGQFHKLFKLVTYRQEINYFKYHFVLLVEVDKIIVRKYIYSCILL